MEKKLVTIWRFSLAIQADLAQCVLGNHGIQAYVSDANIVSMDWLIGNAVGGVKLDVAAEDAPAALQILAQNPGLIGKAPVGSEEHDDSFKCLACGQVIGESENRCPSCGWSSE